jgi:hypothetical protein
MDTLYPPTGVAINGMDIKYPLFTLLRTVNRRQPVGEARWISPQKNGIFTISVSLWGFLSGFLLLLLFFRNTVNTPLGQTGAKALVA